MATRAVRTRVIDDNEIPSQLDEVSMEAANEIFKSMSGLSKRGKVTVMAQNETQL